MNKINIKNLYRRSVDYLTQNFFEIFIAVYVLLGCFIENFELKILRYSFGLALQLFLLCVLFFKIERKEKFDKKILKKYFVVVLLLILTEINFLIVKTKFLLSVNRLLPLLSIFGIVLAGDRNFKIDILLSIKIFVFLFFILVFAVNCDAVLYELFGKGIWKPIYYLGDRWQGPFGDPNFMCLFSASALIFALLSDFNRNLKTLIVTTFGINALLSRSLSMIGALIFTFIVHLVFKPKTLIKKQMIILIAYAAFMTFYSLCKERFEFFVFSALRLIYDTDRAAQIKATSLIIRFDTQLNALNIFFSSFIGQGPRTLVPLLGCDTHNSYVGFLFELGISGFLLIPLTLKSDFNGSDNAAANYLSTFLMTSSLLLSVHDTAIYSFFILSQYARKNKNLLPRNKLTGVTV